MQPEFSGAPVRARHVAQRAVDGELVLYNPETQHVHVLNGTAAYVWTLCDGRHLPVEIVQELVEHYPESRPDIEQDVVATLTLFHTQGLLSQ
jgi:hypothetical protein